MTTYKDSQIEFRVDRPQPRPKLTITGSDFRADIPILNEGVVPDMSINGTTLIGREAAIKYGPTAH
jgi:hypothetical protein